MPLPAPAELFRAAQQVIAKMTEEAAGKGLAEEGAEGATSAIIPAARANRAMMTSLGDWAPAVRLKNGEVQTITGHQDVENLMGRLGATSPEDLLHHIDTDGFAANGKFLTGDEMNMVRSWFGPDATNIKITSNPRTASTSWAQTSDKPPKRTRGANYGSLNLGP